MKHLYFTARVLGKDAVQKLKDKRIIQTMRGPRCDLVQTYGERKFGDFGERIAVSLYFYMRRQTIGYVRLVSIQEINWVNLTDEDALRGGFLDLWELKKALKRAGYRFKDLEDYDFWRIRFKWEN